MDHEGEVRTGDELLVVFASDLAERGQLAGNTVAVTVMSNLGLHRAMAERNIVVRQTPVGDRYVLEALDSDGLSLGGEQSGHLVFRRLATTGDGILTGILLADLLNRRGRTLAQLASESMTHVPQLLVSVTAVDPRGTVEHEILREELEAVVLELGEEGRVLVRRAARSPWSGSWWRPQTKRPPVRRSTACAKRSPGRSGHSDSQPGGLAQPGGVSPDTASALP